MEVAPRYTLPTLLSMKRNISAYKKRKKNKVCGEYSLDKGVTLQKRLTTRGLRGLTWKIDPKYFKCKTAKRHFRCKSAKESSKCKILSNAKLLHSFFCSNSP